MKKKQSLSIRLVPRVIKEGVLPRSLYILTGDAARLAKMKPPIYGHSHLHNQKCLLEGTKWWRYIA